MSPNASLFHPATLPCDDVAYAVAALNACPVPREVAVWKGFIARVNKGRAPA